MTYSELTINQKINMKNFYVNKGAKYGTKPLNWCVIKMDLIKWDMFVYTYTTN